MAVALSPDEAPGTGRFHSPGEMPGHRPACLRQSAALSAPPSYRVTVPRCLPASLVQRDRIAVCCLKIVEQHILVEVIAGNRAIVPARGFEIFLQLWQRSSNAC